MNLTPNSWGSPVVEYNKCHDDLGKFCSTPTDGWEPSMSLKDATRWAKESAFPLIGEVAVSRTSAARIKREGFSLQHTSVGRVFGEGVYIGIQQDSGAYWLDYKQRMGKDAVVLVVMANIKNPLTISDADLAAPSIGPNMADKVLARLARGTGEDWRALQKETEARAKALSVGTDHGWMYHYPKAVTLLLQKRGYDSLLIKSRTFLPIAGERPDWAWQGTGGDQLVVFNPHHVTVVRP